MKDRRRNGRRNNPRAGQRPKFKFKIGAEKAIEAFKAGLGFVAKGRLVFSGGPGVILLNGKPLEVKSWQVVEES